jgi:hypothetical protein
MNKLILLIMAIGMLSSSCARITNCPQKLNAKIKHSKTLRKTRRNLRVNYHYHQTKIGRFFKFEI